MHFWAGLSDEQARKLLLDNKMKAETEALPHSEEAERAGIGRKSGIEFAHRNVTVYLPPEIQSKRPEDLTEAERKVVEAGAAAAAALAQAEEEEKAKVAVKPKEK